MRAWSSLALLAALAPAGHSQQAAAPVAQRPKYAFLRQNEDWSNIDAFADAERELCDPVKRVPLSDDGAIWASFGGSLRLRAEGWNDFAFGAAPPGAKSDDTFLLTRVRLHSDVHFGEHWRLFGEVKSALATDRDLPGGVRPLDYDALALQQLFVDADFELGEDAALTVRPGRQMIALGAQRLVSPLPWGNSLRTWDGLTGVVTHGAWSFTGLAAAFAPVDRYDRNATDWDQRLYGVYGVGPGGLEAYVLRNERDNAMFNGTAGDEERQTLGLRSHRALGERADYDVELDYQFGRVGAGDVSAWSLASQVGVAAAERVRLWAGLDWASGDERPGGDVGTFNQLYPLGHAYFGITDTIGRQNIVDTSVGATWKPDGDTKLDLAGHSFRVDSTRDAIYNAGGGVVRPGGSFSSSWIGWELDLTASRRFGRHVTAGAGYGHFFAGDAIEESGPSRDTDFFYVTATFTF